MRLISAALVRTCVLTLAAGASLSGQETTPAVKPDSAKAGATAPSALPFAFSGVIYTNYQYGGIKGNRSQNRFDLDRAYLNFRASAGERDSVRVTADVFQQRDTVTSAYYRGWTARLKYAYVQHEYIRGKAEQLKANVRLGMLHTVVVDKEESIWPRGLAQVAVEQAGFFSSSDLGLATSITLPAQTGEIYATITNGSGYSSREVDRFKEYAARVTLTPLAKTAGYLKGLQISPWYLNGNRGSDFARAHGTVQAVAEGRQRDRYGVLVAVRDPRLTLGAHFARRIDIVESADTTQDTAPVATKVTGNVASAYLIAKPLAFVDGAPKWPLGLVLRADSFKPNTDASPSQRNLIAGLSWDFNRRTSVYFDVQSLQPKSGSTAPDNKVWYLHVVANF
jgi:hypothetical protein